MALRVIRLFVPSGTAALKARGHIQKAGVHTSTVNNLEYGMLAYLMGERTLSKFTNNSKIITVDGNLASGKGALAQQLAEKLGMLYMPEADIHYLDRMNKEKVPLEARFNGNCSLEKFYKDPKAKDGNSYRLQCWMYQMRVLQYADAMEHLLSTGQGVVLERSPFSDVVFVEAMRKQGYIRKQCVDHYDEIKEISICEFLQPHLVIYVDLPAEEVQKKLKASGQDVPLPYLKSIEEAYKKTFLPSISEKAEVLAYDATQGLDIVKVLDDIEYLKFEKGDWAEQDNVNYHHMRLLVQDKQMVANLTCIARYLPEITVSAHNVDSTYYAYQSLPGKSYAEGYNADMGDKNILFK
ncbi:NADH dehydrogenase [ubiquinone] 1 alpha subcomplex subunit 10, mitochondrial [Sardina pilchardus]|uniref:NADH dehydrogenase [ubiquinone] 1 alpha subcomplex subunit 10, mitochondrial n=1 Tax=Sardina pilchardus TaxID=27697 RepID=UPI002E0D184C